MGGWKLGRSTGPPIGKRGFPFSPRESPKGPSFPGLFCSPPFLTKPFSTSFSKPQIFKKNPVGKFQKPRKTLSPFWEGHGGGRGPGRVFMQIYNFLGFWGKGISFFVPKISNRVFIENAKTPQKPPPPGTAYDFPPKKGGPLKGWVKKTFSPPGLKSFIF